VNNGGICLDTDYSEITKTFPH